MIQQTRFYVIFRDITLIIFTSKLLLLCFSWINEACFPFLLQNFSSLLFILPSKPKKSTSYNLFICFSKLENTKHCAAVTNIWSDVEPYMQLHPNVLLESTLIEEQFFIPKKEELIRNKDLEPWEQSHHIQAPTILSKLQFTECLQNRISTEQKNFHW